MFQGVWIRRGRAVNKPKETSLAILSNFYSVVYRGFFCAQSSQYPEERREVTVHTGTSLQFLFYLLRHRPF